MRRTDHRPLAPTGEALRADLVDPARWDELVAEFDGMCQEQTLAFAAPRWPTVAIEPLLFSRGGVPVGGTLVMIRRLPLGLGGLVFCKWGPMLRDAAAPDAPSLYAAMVDRLVADYAQRRNMMLSILPRAATDGGNAQFELLLARGFRPGSQVGFPTRYIVDLSLPDDLHRKRLGSKWRYHLARSEKQGLTFEEAPPERLPEFSALYAAMSARKRFPDYSAFRTVPDLMAIPQNHLRPALFLVRHGGEAVAGAVIFRAGDTACYLYGATDDRALALRAGYFMHWQIIRWLKRETRARWYDLGGTDGFAGLHQFKKTMVGEAGIMPDLPPMANYAARALAFAIGRGALAARDRAQHVRSRLLSLRSDYAKPDLDRA